MTTSEESSIFTKLYQDYETTKVGVSFSSLISGVLAEYFIRNSITPSVATNGYNIVLSGIRTGKFFFIPISVSPTIYSISESVDVESFDSKIKYYGTPVAILSNSSKMRFLPTIIFPLYINEEEIIDGVVINADDFFSTGQEGTITISLDGKIYNKVYPLVEDNIISRRFLSLSSVSEYTEKALETKKDKGTIRKKISTKSKKKRYKKTIKSLKQEVLFLRQKSL